MSLCDHHHAQEQEDDAVAGGRHGPDTDDMEHYRLKIFSLHIYLVAYFIVV